MFKFIRQCKDDARLKKMLGVLYVPIMIAMNRETDLVVDEDLLSKIGITTRDLMELIQIASDAYEKESFKAHGNIDVVEALNYFEVEGEEPIKAYYSRL